MKYTYPHPLITGKLVQRYKRFFADIALESGEIVTAHCPNTGPMTGVCEIGAPVQLSHHQDPKRKLAYTWEMIWVDQVWVGVNTSMPNRLVHYGLQQNWFAELSGFTQLSREVAYGSQSSKIDFLLTSSEGRVYVEVKNTTWSQKQRALFPDTVTIRGQKHLQELMQMVSEGHRAVLLYFIHRVDCPEFSPGDSKDPTYGKLLRQAVAAGVEVLPYRFQVSPAGVECLGKATLYMDPLPIA
ncbi:MAG: DNA/RNA nuclease SfsA [Synechococcaceae cyanobacterium SM2_3_1]|nr:DNA/RNA nuclease SfsA [Synechococcaceae cyanobacterium SM2_3_1]